MWFRFYTETLDDPKVQRLSAEHFRSWVNLLCIAKKYDGKLPSETDCAFMLRVTPEAFHETFTALNKAGLFDEKGGRKRFFEPHNWTNRQYKSDSSTERVKQFRKRQCNVSVTPRARDRTETETETETEERNLPSVGKERAADAAGQPQQSVGKNDGNGEIKPTRKQGTRLQENWQPDERDCRYALDHGLDPGAVAEQFVDWWIAQPGQKGVKLDWAATWRTWCRREAERRRDRPKPTGIVAGALEDIAALESEV